MNIYVYKDVNLKKKNFSNYKALSTAQSVLHSCLFLSLAEGITQKLFLLQV